MRHPRTQRRPAVRVTDLKLHHRAVSYPILEYDPTRVAIIEASDIHAPSDVPEAAVLCFFSEVIEKLTAEGRAIECVRWRGEQGPTVLYQVEIDGWARGAPPSWSRSAAGSHTGGKCCRPRVPALRGLRRRRRPRARAGVGPRGRADFGNPRRGDLIPLPAPGSGGAGQPSSGALGGSPPSRSRCAPCARQDLDHRRRIPRDAVPGQPPS